MIYAGKTPAELAKMPHPKKYYVKDKHDKMTREEALNILETEFKANEKAWNEAKRTRIS